MTNIAIRTTKGYIIDEVLVSTVHASTGIPKVIC